MSPAAFVLDYPSDAVRDALTSPVGIATQGVALVALVLFLRLDWAEILDSRKHGDAVGAVPVGVR